MTYEFACPECRAYKLVTRSVDDRNRPLLCLRCDCNKITSWMRRLVSVPAALITRRLVDEPEVKYFAGFSEKDRLAKVLESDKEYSAMVAKREKSARENGANPSWEPKDIDTVSERNWKAAVQQSGLADAAD